MHKRASCVWLITVIGILAMTAGCHRRTGMGLGLDVMYNNDTARRPTVTIERTVLPPIKILTITFEVYTEEDIGRYLNAGYVALCTYINQHRLPSNRVMAFYYTYDMPYVIEAAVEVDSVPPVPDSVINARILEGGEVVIAHYKGPYEKAALAYHAIYKWLEDNHRNPREHPFEVYLNDPITIRNKNDLRTDIYQFIR